MVQDHATVRYEVRSPFVSQLRPLFDRVVDVAKGAALMTGTEMSCELAMAFTEYVPNKALAKIADEALAEVGAPKWDERTLRWPGPSWAPTTRRRWRPLRPT